jgi:hypothetical protein
LRVRAMRSSTRLRVSSHPKPGRPSAAA